MTPSKSAVLVLVLAVALSAAAATASSSPAVTKRNAAVKSRLIKYIYTAHAKAVAGVCRNSFEENRRLCLKTLKHVPSDDPLDLVKASLTTGNDGVKKAIVFLDGLKPRYKNNENLGLTLINSCKHYLNYALDSYQEVWQAIGKDWGSFNRGYLDAISSIDAAYSYHSTCLNDILDEETLKVFSQGVDLSRNITMTAQGLMRNMDGVIASFGLRVPLPKFAKLNVEEFM